MCHDPWPWVLFWLVHPGWRFLCMSGFILNACSVCVLVRFTPSWFSHLVDYTCPALIPFTCVWSALVYLIPEIPFGLVGSPTFMSRYPTLCSPCPVLPYLHLLCSWFIHLTAYVLVYSVVFLVICLVTALVLIKLLVQFLPCRLHLGPTVPHPTWLFFVLSAFICLFVSKITQKVMNASNSNILNFNSLFMTDWLVVIFGENQFFDYLTKNSQKCQKIPISYH